MSWPVTVWKRWLVTLLFDKMGPDRATRLLLARKRILARFGLIPGPASFWEGEPASILRSNRRLSALEAIVSARTIGGRISDVELERLYVLGPSVRKAIWIGGRREFEQVAGVLAAAGAKQVERYHHCNEERTFSQPIPIDVDTVIIDPFVLPPIDVRALSANLGPGQRLVSIKTTPRKSIKEKIEAGERLGVVMLNDLGFQGGAGIALRRQAQSFLLLGWDVVVVCWSPGSDVAEPRVCGQQFTGRWGGVHSLLDAHRATGLSDTQIIAKITAAVNAIEPDLVIVGNLHGASWPVDVMAELRDCGAVVIAYMHDVHWATGRCAYPGSCSLYLEGCDATCPTAGQYPRLNPNKIASAWQHRADIFTGEKAIPLVGNSRWTTELARLRFGSTGRIDTIRLALDHKLFTPINQRLARRLLGLNENGFLVLLGAQSIKDPRKGGPAFSKIHHALRNRSDIGMLLFGHHSERLSCTKSFGLVADEGRMPLIYSAADVFVGTATEEAFGQTLLEAASCGVPTIAFRVGGVSDAVQDQTTGVLLDDFSAEAAVDWIERLQRDEETRCALGSAARKMVQERFTLFHQAKAWVAYLKQAS
jgi:hypothetical protein